jgi:hypothetical protein
MALLTILTKKLLTYIFFFTRGLIILDNLTIFKKKIEEKFKERDGINYWFDFGIVLPNQQRWNQTLETNKQEKLQR